MSRWTLESRGMLVPHLVRMRSVFHFGPNAGETSDGSSERQLVALEKSKRIVDSSMILNLYDESKWSDPYHIKLNPCRGEWEV